MKVDWQNWNAGGKVIFVAACIATGSMILPWVDIGIASANGIAQGTILLLGLWVYPVLMVMQNKPMSKGGGLACAIGSVVLTLGYISNKQGSVGRISFDAAGAGAYIFLLASIAFIVGVAKYQPPAADEWRQ